MEHSKQIMDQYMPLIRANAYKFSRFDFDETVDESSMMLIEAIGEYDETRGSFGNYLKNKLRYHYLDKAKKPVEESLDSPDETGTPLLDGLISNDDFETDLVRDECYVELYKAISKLSARDKSIIKMKFWDDMAKAEIGEVLGISSKTVANRMSMALGVLRDELREFR